MASFLKVNQQLLNCGLKSIAGTYALEVASIAESVYQLDGDQLLSQAGLKREEIESEHVQIPSFHFFALLLNIIRLTQDESIGLHLGTKLDLKAFHMLGYVLMNCKNLGEMLERTLKYERLVLESSMTTFEQYNDHQHILKWDFAYKDFESRYFYELIISGWWNISRNLVDDPSTIKADSVYFPHSPPRQGIKEYEQIFGCPVYFEADFCGTIFDSNILKIPYNNQDPVLSKLMGQYADAMLQELNDNVSFLSEARACIYRMMPSGDMSFEHFAEKMGLTHKSIQYRFKKSKMTYSELLDDVRRILSMIYLENPNIFVLDVALLVGFTDQSSFSRAFKKWYGVTPGDYKQTAMKNGGLYTKKIESLLHLNHLPPAIRSKFDGKIDTVKQAKD